MTKPRSSDELAQAIRASRPGLAAEAALTELMEQLEAARTEVNRYRVEADRAKALALKLRKELK